MSRRVRRRASTRAVTVSVIAEATATAARATPSGARSPSVPNTGQSARTPTVAPSPVPSTAVTMASTPAAPTILASEEPRERNSTLSGRRVATRSRASCSRVAKPTSATRIDPTGLTPEIVPSSRATRAEVEDRPPETDTAPPLTSGSLFSRSSACVERVESRGRSEVVTSLRLGVTVHRTDGEESPPGNELSGITIGPNASEPFAAFVVRPVVERSANQRGEPLSATRQVATSRTVIASGASPTTSWSPRCSPRDRAESAWIEASITAPGVFGMVADAPGQRPETRLAS
jgi:hypothetical protein